MSLRSRPSMFLWVLAIALLPVRMVDAHMHLCLDGGGPPVSLHVEDVPTHDGDSDVGNGHTDRDVDIPNPVLAKKGGASGDESIAVLGFYVLALILPPVSTSEPLFESQPPALQPLFDLRPPLRGPPA